MRGIIVLLITALIPFAPVRALGAPREPTPIIAEARKDGEGFLVHEVRSPYQTGTTLIRVLLPERLPKQRRYPVIFVLPVEAGSEKRYGDGLLEVKKCGLHNKVQAIFVAPTFSHLPWYADHPTRAEVRQESYFLKVVVPYIARTYPVQDARGRHLLGFSKSGWGAYSLLLRHPEEFGKAVAWDAPLFVDKPDRYGMGEIFDTQANFERYRIAKLLEKQAQQFQREQRLILLGYGNFREQHAKAHSFMKRLGIEHLYQDGPARKHDWHSGWVVEGVNALGLPSGQKQTDSP